MPVDVRADLAALLGEAPASAPAAASAAPVVPRPRHPGPWRVTARISGKQVQISNHHESRVVPAAMVETYLRQNARGAVGRLL